MRRTWDTETAREMIADGVADQYVAAHVGATVYAIRIFRLREKYELTRNHRRYEITVPGKQRPNYKEELANYISRSAKKLGINDAEFKHWMFKTPEGIQHCMNMNRALRQVSD